MYSGVQVELREIGVCGFNSSFAQLYGEKKLDCDCTSRDEALREIDVRAIVTKQSKQYNLRLKARWNIFKWPHVKHVQKQQPKNKNGETELLREDIQCTKTPKNILKYQHRTQNKTLKPTNIYIIIQPLYVHTYILVCFCNQ